MTTATTTVPGLATPETALRLLGQAKVLALDLETCSGPGKGMADALNPRQGTARLLSLAVDGYSLVLDLFAYPKVVPSILDALRGKIVLCHNGQFDLSFLWHLGLRDLPECVDTYLLSKLLAAGVDGFGFGGDGYNSLAACVLRHCGTCLPKELQQSDWSGPLTAEQIAYSRRDAEVLVPLVRALRVEIDKVGLERAADVELRCLPAWVWLTQSGVPFDRHTWVRLAEAASRRKGELVIRLDAMAPPKTPDGLFGPTDFWNWDSPQQAGEVFEQLGCPLGIEVRGRFHPTTNDAALALCDHPLADVLRAHRHEAQLVKMYGLNWLDAATIADSRLYPDWRQLGTVTGRTSCRGPNAQQIPRDEEDGKTVYRTPFRAPPGRVLVKADYAQLQMRIACLYAKDVALFNVFRAGEDTHTATARRTLGKQDVSKAERQIAKSQNFCLVFMGSAEALRVYVKTTYGVTLTAAEAKAHRDAFFRAYPGLKGWHDGARRTKARETRSVLGRRRLLTAQTPDTERVNSPTQGAEADGAKLALALLWERRAQCPSARPVLFNHDEIVVECEADQGEAVKGWLVDAMTDAMAPILDPVPCRVDAAVVPTWGG